MDELFRCDELDSWAEQNNLIIQRITIYVFGSEGFLFRAETAYPLPKKLTVNIHDLGNAEQVETALSEIWFNGMGTFAVFDCSGRFPLTRRLIIH